MVQRPLLLGHRGARIVGCACENSFPAFDLALQHGCDGFEFDVCLTKDARPVVCHGPQPEKRSMCKTHQRPVSTASLEDVVQRYHRRAFLNVELKTPRLEHCVLDALRAHPPEHGYVVSSFSADVLWELTARRDHLVLGTICEKHSQLELWPDLPVDYVIVHESLFTQRLVDLVHDAGKKIFVWTVNDKKSMQRFAAMGVDGLISDNTRLLVKTLATGSG